MDATKLGKVPIKLFTDVLTALEEFSNDTFIHSVACIVSLWTVLKALYRLLCAFLAFCVLVSIAAVMASLDRARAAAHNFFIAIRSATRDISTSAKANLSLTRLACRNILTAVKDWISEVCAATMAALNRGGAVCYNVITNPTALFYPTFLGYTYHQVFTRLVTLLCVWIAMEYCLRAAMGVDQEEFRNVVRLAAARTPSMFVRLCLSLFGHLPAFSMVFCTSTAITGAAFALYNVGNFFLSHLTAIVVALWDLLNVRILGYSLRPFTVILLLTRSAVHISLTSPQFSLWIANRLLDFHEYFECVIFESDGECRAGGSLDPALMLAGIVIGLLATVVMFWKRSNIKARLTAVQLFLTSTVNEKVGNADAKAGAVTSDTEKQADDQVIIEANVEPDTIRHNGSSDENANRNVIRNEWSDADINDTDEPNHQAQATNIEVTAHSTTEAVERNSITDENPWIANNARDQDKASNELNKLSRTNEGVQSVEQFAADRAPDWGHSTRSLNSSAQNPLRKIASSEISPMSLTATAAEQPPPYSVRPATSLDSRPRSSPSTLPSAAETALYPTPLHAATPSKPSSIAATIHPTTNSHEKAEYEDFEEQLHKSFNLSPRENLDQIVMPARIADTGNSIQNMDTDPVDSSERLEAQDVETVVDAPERNVASLAAVSSPPPPRDTTPSESFGTADTTQPTTDVHSEGSVDEWAGLEKSLDKLNKSSNSSLIEGTDIASTSKNMNAIGPEAVDALSVETVTKVQVDRSGAAKSDPLSLSANLVLEPTDLAEEDSTVLDNLDRIAAPSHLTGSAKTNEKRLDTERVDDPDHSTREDIEANPLPVTTGSNSTNLPVQELRRSGLDTPSVSTLPIHLSSTAPTRSQELRVNSATRVEVSAQLTPPPAEDSPKPFFGMPVDTSSPTSRRLPRGMAKKSIVHPVNFSPASQAELPKNVQEKDADLRASVQLALDSSAVHSSSKIDNSKTEEATRTPPATRPFPPQSLGEGHINVSTPEEDNLDLYRRDETVKKLVSTGSTIMKTKAEEIVPASSVTQPSPQQRLSGSKNYDTHVAESSDIAKAEAKTPVEHTHSGKQFLNPITYFDQPLYQVQILNLILSPSTPGLNPV
jgi:hypothetical protein